MTSISTSPLRAPLLLPLMYAIITSPGTSCFSSAFRSVPFFFFFSPGFIFLGIVDQIFVGSGCCRGDQQTVNDQQWITIFYNGRVCTFDLTEIQVE